MRTLEAFILPRPWLPTYDTRVSFSELVGCFFIISDGVLIVPRKLGSDRGGIRRASSNLHLSKVQRIIKNKKINMNVIKISFGTVVLLLGSLLFVGIASAASITNAEFAGNTEVYGNPSSSKDVTLRIVVPSTEVVEYVETDVISDGLAPVCNKVGGEKGLEEGTHNVKLSVKLPPNTGTYDLAVQTNGIFGAIRTVDCEDTAGDVDTASFGGVIRVIPNASSSNDDNLGSEESSLIASLRAMIKDLMAQIAELSKPPVVVKPACPIAYNGSNAWEAQAWLLGNGYASGFTAIGVYAPTGFWGKVSAAAYMSAMNACK